MKMKYSVSFRPRIVIKRYPEKLDPEEIGIVFDRQNKEFYVCPPNLDPENEAGMIESWNLFFDFVDIIPEFEFDKSWLGNMPLGIRESCVNVLGTRKNKYI